MYAYRFCTWCVVSCRVGVRCCGIFVFVRFVASPCFRVWRGSTVLYCGWLAVVYVNIRDSICTLHLHHKICLVRNSCIALKWHGAAGSIIAFIVRNVLVELGFRVDSQNEHYCYTPEYTCVRTKHDARMWLVTEIHAQQ